jgi:hypothetical protein
MKRILIVATMALLACSTWGCGCGERLFRRGETCAPACGPCGSFDGCSPCGTMGTCGTCAAPEAYMPTPVPVPVR